MRRRRVLTLGIGFVSGSRFAVSGADGQHPVHDTVTKCYRHPNFFRHECILEVRVPRVPRVRLPDGSVRQVEPPWAGKLSGFTLLFEALMLVLCQQMTFSVAARLVGESGHRVRAICGRYVELALGQTDLSSVHSLAIDETSRARGHDYITLAADADERRLVAVAEGRDAATSSCKGVVDAKSPSRSIGVFPANDPCGRRQL